MRVDKKVLINSGVLDNYLIKDHIAGKKLIDLIN